MVAAARCGLVRVVLRLWVLAATEAIGRWLATAGVTGRGPPRAVGDGAGRRANAARRGGPRVRGGVGAGLQGGPSARGGGAPRCCGCVAGAPPPPSAGGAPQKPVSPTHARWGLASWRARAAETACARWILCRAMWLAGGPAAAHRRRPAGCVEFFAQGRRTSRDAGARRATARARRPRRAPAGPAAHAGYIGYQPPLQHARQRAGAHGCSPRQAQCAGSKQREPDGEDPAGSR